MKSLFYYPKKETLYFLFHNTIKYMIIIVSCWI